MLYYNKIVKLQKGKQMKIIKSRNNPIIKISDLKPSRDDFKIIGVFNAGAIEFKGKKILLLRVAETPINTNDDMIACPLYNDELKKLEIIRFDINDDKYDFSDPRIIKSKFGQNYLTSISHIRRATSDDGINFIVDECPIIMAFDKYTTFGVEDPRITKIEDVFYVNFSAASDVGIITRLFSTKDFNSFDDLGNIFHPDNKDITIFPQKINGLYYALHRPSTSEYSRPNMWIASSPDLIHWGNHRLLAKVREDMWDNDRIGASCVPFLTEKGWLELYHGATKDNRYCLGAMLLDKDEPWKIIARCDIPLIEPTESYEINGFFGNVVFSCGLIKTDNNLDVYYGASDDSVCLAHTTVENVFDLLKV